MKDKTLQRKTRLKQIPGKFSVQEIQSLEQRRNRLIFQRGILEAQMLRLSNKVQRQRIKKAVDDFYYHAIQNLKIRGKSTNRLEKKQRESGKVVDKIMNLSKAKESRHSQKVDIATSFAELGFVGSGLFIAGGAIGAGEGSASVGAGGSAMALGSTGLIFLRNYWEKRGGIKAMKKEYKKEIDKIEKKLKRQERKYLRE